MDGYIIDYGGAISHNFLSHLRPQTHLHLIWGHGDMLCTYFKSVCCALTQCLHLKILRVIDLWIVHI